MSRFLNERYRDLESYTPGEQPQDMQYVKLNTNESPYPPAPEVIAAVNSDEVRKLNLYSDPECKKLREKIAGLYGVEPENIFTANGSDDILNFAFMSFADNGVVFPDISYGFYKVFADLHKLSYETVPLKEDFSIDGSDYFHKGKMVVIANPNAPTGIALKSHEIEEIVKTNTDNVVLIDEAYVDFGGESVYPLIKKYDNLLVVQTYSKSRSMAGGRLGFAIGSKELIADLEKIKYSTNPYNINRLTQIAGETAIDANEYYTENCRRIINTREYTSEKLRELGFSVLPSKANFIFAKSECMSGEYVYRELKRRGVLVRHFTAERIKDYNRITIGTEEQMDVMLANLKDMIEKVT